jgi:hypothetical protein
MVSTKNVATHWLLLVLGLLLGAPLAGRAQIVDDSTKVLYGPKTTRVIYEAEVQRDSTRGTIIDTSLVHWPQQRFWFHDSTFQQDLGTVGSASRPLLYRPNLELGARLGRNVFDRYARDASQVPYYDSRSPYSFFRYVQTSAGEQVFEISYSRSLKKNFSIGLDYERFASNKVLGENTGAGLVEHNSTAFTVRYQTEDERYHLLASLVNTRHRAVEQGGIRPLATDTTLQQLFTYDRAQVNLTAAANTDDRDQLHLFHSYRLLGRGLTAYHIFDIRRQYNGYLDNTLPRNTTTNGLLFYPTTGPLLGTYRNPTATVDRTTYRQAENTVGVRGHSDRIEYNLYGRYRAATLTQTSDSIARSTTRPAGKTPYSAAYNQVFFGGSAAFNYRTIYAVDVSGEVKPLGANSLGEYILRGRIRTGPLSAEVLTTSYSPTLTQQRFVGNHYDWDRTKGDSAFVNTKTNQVSVSLKQRLPFLADHAIELSGTAAYLTNLVYYNQRGLPDQLPGTNQLLIGFARHRFRVGRVFVDNQATYTRGGDVQGIRIPELVTESRIYYQTYVFGKAAFSQIGAEVYYQSRFRGYQYSPSTQQFYLQDNFTIRNYAVANVFLAADINRVALFLKVAYVNQGLDSSGNNGYFTTPYYTGYPRRFQLGVRWKFFS